MNATEAMKLCRMVKAVCPSQKIDELTPDFWHPLLEDIDIEAASRAVIEVAKRQPFVSPAEIRAEVAVSKRRMVAAIPPVVPPWQLADLPEDESRWIADYRHAIADGLPSERARMRANHIAGLTGDEPPAIEERPSLRDELNRAERGRLDAIRMAQIKAEVGRKSHTDRTDAA